MAFNPYNTTTLEPYLRAHPETQFIFVQWLDYFGHMRVRCVTIKHFLALIAAGERLRISYGNLGTTQNDHMTPVCLPVGAICVEPDGTFQSLRPMHVTGPIQNSATVMARFIDDKTRLPMTMCPRASLQSLTQQFADKHGITFLVGFEIEITFLKRNANATGPAETFSPLDTTHAWGTFLEEQYTTGFPLALEVINALQAIGIDVQVMHAESGPGQYEFVLPPFPPALAVDTLIQARQCIMHVAASHGMRATCHCMPFPGIGSGSHVHMSFNSSTRHPTDIEKVEQSFMAAVLEHMPALCAFTMPQAASYGRVAESSWTGGTYVAWGTENREVPLRKSGPRRWEIRCLDGFANMYLALTAVFAVGLMGVEKGLELKMGDCQNNPAHMSAHEKRELGITHLLPTSIHDAVKLADKDVELERAMPEGMLKHYLIMKKYEQDMLHKMPAEEQRVWLIERY